MECELRIGLTVFFPYGKVKSVINGKSSARFGKEVLTRSGHGDM